MIRSVEDIQRAVCEHFSIRLADLRSQRRHRSVARPRMVAMYLCRQRLDASYTEIGELFGGKDHTTVMSAVRKIAARRESDAGLAESIEAIERKLDRGVSWDSITFRMEPNSDPELTCIACGLRKCGLVILVHVPWTGRKIWSGIHRKCVVKHETGQPDPDVPWPDELAPEGEEDGASGAVE